MRTPLELADAHPGPAFTVTLDGREIEALPGQTVAAALWAACSAASASASTA